MINLREILDSYCVETRSYSGRGMYGKTNLATCELSEKKLLKLAMEIGVDYVLDDLETGEDSYSEFSRVISNYRVDSIGLGIVIYWPDVPWDIDDEEEWEDE